MKKSAISDVILNLQKRLIMLAGHNSNSKSNDFALSRPVKTCLGSIFVSYV